MELRATKRSDGGLDLFLGDEPWRTLHVKLLSDLPPFPIQLADAIEAEELFAEWQRRGALLYIGRLVSHQERLERQVRSRLAECSVDEGVVDELIAHCRKVGWIDDERWVDSYVRGQERRLKGPRAIRMKLLQKGAPAGVVDERLADLKSDEAQKQAIAELVERRYLGKEPKKLYQALVRRGFDPSIVRDYLRC